MVRYDCGMADKKHPGGRPTKYNKEFHPKLALLLAEKGLTLPQIAEQMKVAPSTVSKWQVEHVEFSEALKNGKEGPDDLVERSLFERATGFKHTVQKPMSVSNGTGMGSEIEIVEFEERIVPDVTAQIFWLKNRRPERWREKVDQVHSGTVSVTTMTREQALEEVKRLESQLEKG